MVASGRNRRHAKRVKANNLVTYSAVRADRLYKLLGLAVTLDLSETGLRVRTSEPLPLSEELDLKVKLGEHTYSVRGRVVWGSELEVDRSYEFGVRFKEMDFGLARELWDVAEGALAAAPAPAAAEVPALDKLVASLSRTLDGGEGTLHLGADERELLRRVVSAMAPGERAGALLALVGAAPAPATPPRVLEAGPPLLQAQASHDSPGQPIVLTVSGAGKGRPFRERVPTPRPRGTVGHFEGDQLIEFVQMLGVQAKTGVLEVHPEDEGTAQLAFREGTIIAARTPDDARGEAAAHRIMAIRSGHFEFWPHNLSAVVAEHSLSVQSLILEVMRLRDEKSPEP